MELQKTIEVLERRIHGTLSPKRYAHSRNTAILSASIAGQHGLDENLGYLAGLVHDMAKCFGTDELFSFLEVRGYAGLNAMAPHPEILHGPVARYILAEEYSVFDSGILESVELHSTGALEMQDLSKIVYVADKIEPGRKHASERIRSECRSLPLDLLFFKVLEETMLWFQDSSVLVYPETVFLYNSLKGGIR